MSSINNITILGNLGQDPEVKHLENGAVVANFSVATTESWKDKQGEWQNKTTWHKVVAWKYLAERIDRYFKKGMQVYVQGKIDNRKWIDKDGNDRYITEIIANEAFTTGKREERETAPAPAQQEQAKPVGGDDDSSLPF